MPRAILSFVMCFVIMSLARGTFAAYSLDVQSATVISSGGSIGGADIYALLSPFQIASESSLGLLPGSTGSAEIDAISDGFDLMGFPLFFSVDEYSTGVANVGPTPNVYTEGALGTNKAAGSVFIYSKPYQTHLQPTDLNTIYGNRLWSTMGIVGVTSPGDDIDALDFETRMMIFSLDSAFADPMNAGSHNSGTAAANGVVGGDIIGGGPNGLVVLFHASELGLDLQGPDTDDLDAIFYDGVWNHSDSILLFSVRRGSAVIGELDSRLGLPIEPGDILTIPAAPGLTPQIYIPAETLGLHTIRTYGPNAFGTADDLNALGGAIPEPATLSLFALGSLVLTRRRI